MTGFARADDHDAACGWTWEVKSVNGRGLDIRCRVPSGFDRIEPLARTRIAERFARGSIAVTLTLTRAADATRYAINRSVLDDLLRVAGEAAEAAGAAPPRVDALLAVRGVIETVTEEEDEAVRAARDRAIVGTLDRALDALAATRTEEGGRLAKVLRGQLDELKHLQAAASGHAATQPALARDRLGTQIAALLDDTPPVSEERLAQEITIAATKADVSEELDRLTAHIEAAGDLVDQGGAAGRRLDFLCQELNREANTICSKSIDLALSRDGLELKTVIDRFREQIQNIE
jgi:uncharacterized protein (TIGR00255 family)